MRESGLGIPLSDILYEDMIRDEKAHEIVLQHDEAGSFDVDIGNKGQFFLWSHF
jgi:hypothetical protein